MVTDRLLLLNHFLQGVVIEFILSLLRNYIGQLSVLIFNNVLVHYLGGEYLDPGGFVAVPLIFRRRNP